VKITVIALFVLPTCLLLGPSACGGKSTGAGSPASSPESGAASEGEVANAAGQIDTPPSGVPSVTPSAGESVVPESPFSCEDVGGECMEGCEPGFMPHDTPHHACFDSVCCVADTTPTCKDLGGECMEGCDAGYVQVDRPTRGCVDSGCCVAE